VPLDDEAFAARMADLGPFEHRPHVAVAVSGGSDSLCLALLAGRWAARRGGQVTGLSVDHGLRAQSRAEADRVGEWLRRQGMDHHILSWRGPKPVAGIQAAARDARYRLMGDWCRGAGVLHLLLGHTLDDQAETFLLRLAKGSGAEGLAAMAAIRETPDVRLLRPLLDVSKSALRATLDAEGQDWIEDPSNQNPAFARVRVRQSMRDGGLDAAALARSAHRFGRLRQALESSVSQVLARGVDMHPAGFAVLRPSEFVAAADEIGLSALSRVVVAVGGNSYPPRLEKLERLYRELRGAVSGGNGFRGRTLGGCRVMAGTGRFGGELVVCRESRGLSEAVTVDGGARLVWDRRFEIQFKAFAPRPRLQALGDEGWRDINGQCGELRGREIPHPARLTLPALFDEKGVLCVPHLGFRRGDSTPDIATIRFYPPNSLLSAGFFLRSGPDILSLGQR
jgi:tRNA(Ile)-lysidine synthase